ncbi:MAG: hypothetical protein K6G08_00490 [Prevotella sp.]|nr:hypothetical protein [Prevotella sp.]
MNRIAIYTIAVIILFVSGYGRSDAQHLQATVEHYSTEDGLASNAIASMTQDDYGFIWLATWNGLSRFDGYNFYNYKTGASSHIRNLHNRILDMVIDNQQNVWLRMYDGRVFVMKRSIDKIINPFDKVGGSDEFRTTHPLLKTSSGDVLADISGVGLYKLRMEKAGVSAQLITTGGLTITSMAEGYQSDIWLGTDRGVHRMDASNQTIERRGILLDEHITCLFSNGYNIFGATESGKIFSFSYGQEPQVIRDGLGDPINALFVDSHGLVWFSDSRMGASFLEPETGEERFFSQTVTTPDYDGFGGFFNEVGGVVWVRMNHGGYGYYNRETGEVEYFHNDPSNPWNLSNTIHAQLELPEGVVWISTVRNGLDKLEIMKNTITRTQLVPSEESSMENEIRAMYYDRERQLLLIGNKASTIYFFNNAMQLLSTVTQDNSGQPLGRIYGLSKDSKGNYWAATKGNGLFRITPLGAGYSVTNFRHDDNDPNSLSNDATYATVEDGQGNLWVATYGGGVNVLAKNKQGQLAFLNPKKGMSGYPYNSHRKVRTLAVGKDGKVWAGTTDGIIMLSYHKGEVKVEPMEPSEEDVDKILQSNDVVCMARANDGTMWVGTNGGGISHTVGHDSKGRWLFETFGAKDGLPSEEIRSMAFDDRGNVWFACDHIVCSYDVGKHIFTAFSALDGVDETLCSEGGATALGNGNILIGTVNGYYTIDKKKLINQTGSVLKLRITDFWLNDELQSPRLTDKFDYYVPESRRLEIPSHSDLISFRFSSLNYQLQHRVHYQYIMEGYDSKWQNADISRTATYNNLPTGTYRFKVKAFLLESPEKYDIRELEIVIPPYFLLSQHAIWLYMALVALFGLSLMFWQQRRLCLRMATNPPADQSPQTAKQPTPQTTDFHHETPKPPR